MKADILKLFIVFCCRRPACRQRQENLFFKPKLKELYPDLKKDKDIGDTWFLQLQKGGPLCVIDDLKERYSAHDVSSLLNLQSNKTKLHTHAEKVDYYRLSASFCEYLSEEIGFEKLLTIAKRQKKGSILKGFAITGIQIQPIYEKWLADNFNTL